MKKIACFCLSFFLASCGVSVEKYLEHKVIIPAYFYPTDADWNKVFSIPSELSPIVILDPDAEGGPGSEEDPLYTQLIERLNEKKFLPIGYVYTTYAQRNLDDVKADIDTWLELYPGIKGFFIDEVTNDNDTYDIDYYRAVYSYIKSKGNYFVVLNPGTRPPDDYFSFADNVVVLENSYDVFKTYGCTSNFPEKSSCIIYGASESDMENVTASADVSYLYVTDDNDDFPFDRLPVYWDKEIEIFK
ncbi:spherulation-specific family 4 protein [Desulfurobacterium sp.]